MSASITTRAWSRSFGRRAVRGSLRPGGVGLTRKVRVRGVVAFGGAGRGGDASACAAFLPASVSCQVTPQPAPTRSTAPARAITARLRSTSVTVASGQAEAARSAALCGRGWLSRRARRRAARPLR